MKCVNCGANYTSTDNKCPFCGTLNQKRKIFELHRKKADSDYKKVRKQLEPWFYRLSVNTVLNRILFIEVAFGIVLVILEMMFSMTSLGGDSLAAGMSKRQCKERIVQLYNDEQFSEMAELVYDSDVYLDNDMKMYVFMADLYENYELFCRYKAKYIAGVKEQDVDDYDINLLITYMSAILSREEYYRKNLSESQEYIDAYVKETEAFAVNMLGLEEEHIEKLRETDYIKDEDKNVIRKAVKARGVTYEPQ